MPVDAALLKQIGQWRLLLAQSLAAQNELDQQALNSTVRYVVDRLLVLRICEAQGLQPARGLNELVVGGDRLVRLDLLFRKVDTRFHLDRSSCQRSLGRSNSIGESDAPLQIDASVLQAVIAGLNQPAGNHVDSDLGVELLGRVHEQYLDNVIHCRDDRTVVTAQWESARKPGGVYYTPSYVVDYIVERTLTPWLRRASRPQDAMPNLLDPACGAGAFLVAAYRRLMDWHREWYAANDPAKHTRSIRRTSRGRWVLTRAERERILLNCIYGVDVDRQAVQATRLSLLLSLLNSGDDCGTDRQLPLLDGDELPDLRHNVQCGDSLVSTELSAADDSSALSGPLNAPLDYPREFPRVFERRNPGFDIVIGNPPYINVRLLAQTVDERVRQHLNATYRCATGLYDIYVLFVERSFNLLRARGQFGMIVPNKIATLDYARACRDLLKRRTTIDEITDLSSLRVFGTAGVYPHLLFWRKQKPKADHLLQVRSVRSPEALHDGRSPVLLLQSSLSVEDGFAIHGCLDVEARVATVPLASLARIHSGTTGFAAKQMADSLVEAADVKAADGEANACFGFIVSGNIDRYRVDLGDVRFQHKDYVCPVLPRSTAWLSDNKRRLYAGQKLIVAGMTKRLEVAWDRDGLALGVQVYAAAELQEDARCLLGILNSKLISHLFRQRFAAKHLAGGYLAINKGQLQKIPIRRVDPSQTGDCERRRLLIELVDRRLDLERRTSDDVADAERKIRSDDIRVADARIDDVVFELYRVTDKERKQIDEQVR